MERLEQTLEEEIKARKLLEKKVTELTNQLTDQKRLTSALELRLSLLEAAVQTPMTANHKQFG